MDLTVKFRTTCTFAKSSIEQKQLSSPRSNQQAIEHPGSDISLPYIFRLGLWLLNYLSIPVIHPSNWYPPSFSFHLIPETKICDIRQCLRVRLCHYGTWENKIRCPRKWAKCFLWIPLKWLTITCQLILRFPSYNFFKINIFVCLLNTLKV